MRRNETECLALITLGTFVMIVMRRWHQRCDRFLYIKKYIDITAEKTLSLLQNIN